MLSGAGGRRLSVLPPIFFVGVPFFFKEPFKCTLSEKIDKIQYIITDMIFRG